MKSKKYQLESCYYDKNFKFPKDIWRGPGYEIGIKFEKVNYNDLIKLSNQVWNHPRTIGPLKKIHSQSIETNNNRENYFNPYDVSSSGVLILANKKPCPCEILNSPSIYWDDSLEIKNSNELFTDVFYIFIRNNALRYCFQEEQALMEKGQFYDWFTEINTLLTEIVKTLYVIKHFKIAVIGRMIVLDDIIAVEKLTKKKRIPNRQINAVLVAHEGKFQFYEKGSPYHIFY